MKRLTNRQRRRNAAADPQLDRTVLPIPQPARPVYTDLVATSTGSGR